MPHADVWVNAWVSFVVARGPVTHALSGTRDVGARAGETERGWVEMKATTTVLQMLVRLTGLLQIVLGALFWTGNADDLIPVHIVSGSVLVLSLLGLALLAARTGVQPGFVALAVAWGLVVLILGLTQERLLPGPAHWTIQALHLLLGLGAIGQAENLARRIGRAIKQPARAPSPAL
jgi:hypothetical protein